jgi:hypothetical protein
LLLFSLIAALTVYVMGHWSAIVDPYVINDDVRQQLYWMQKWSDEEIFKDDILTDYARYYVPWGVKAIYRLGSLFMNPVQFSKVVTGVLFIITAGFIFGLGQQFKNDLTGVVAVCFYFYFTGFLRKISGGLSQSFGFPLLTAYLFFLARGNLFVSALVIMVASVLNPYIFLLCLVTHLLYIAVQYGPELLWKRHAVSREDSSGMRPVHAQSPGRLLLMHIPVLIGIGMMALRYFFLKPEGIGDLVTWSQMLNHIEYTAAGRYPILPVRPILYEIGMPWFHLFPFAEWGLTAGWIGVATICLLGVFGWIRNGSTIDMAGFRVFGYLFPASIFMWGLSYVLILKLFLPERYVEFSLTLFFCLLSAVSVLAAVEGLGLRRIVFPWLIVCAVIGGGFRSYQIGVYDYSDQKDLYKFLKSTPKSSLIAGNPEVIDTVPTFACRKAFVTYELSHTWIDTYWSIIKKRTFDFFKAYYAEDPEEVREFARYYGIDYIVVRPRDFDRNNLEKGTVYFEPFGSWIKELTKDRTHFALFDSKEFPAVFTGNGVFVVKTK